MSTPDRPMPYATEEESLRPDPGGDGPPRSANEPHGSEGSSRTPKTRTDPHTGEPTEGRPDTAG